MKLLRFDEFFTSVLLLLLCVFSPLFGVCSTVVCLFHSARLLFMFWLLWKCQGQPSATGPLQAVWSSSNSCSALNGRWTFLFRREGHLPNLNRNELRQVLENQKKCLGGWSLPVRGGVHSADFASSTWGGEILGHEDFQRTVRKVAETRAPCSFQKSQ